MHSVFSFLVSLVLVSAVASLQAPIVFPNYGAGINNPTCYGSRLDKIELLQDMYVQYAEFMTDVPQMYGFHTCFWIRLDQTNRRSTIINYSINNNTNNDVITLQYSGEKSVSSWQLVVNNSPVYEVNSPVIPAGIWTHHCHSWDGNTGQWSVWSEGKLVEYGFNVKTIGLTIPKGGVLVTGQHQNTLGDGMDRNEGVIGGITLLHLHSRPLVDLKGLSSAANLVKQFSTDCRAFDRGDVVGWLRTGRKTYGGVLTSTATQKCKQF